MLTRRDILKNTSCGFGYLAFNALMSQYVNGMDTHFPAKAKRIIFLFMNGGPSHVDTFDYKPSLETKNDTQDPVETSRKLLMSQAKFTPSGKSGIMISDFFPELQKYADDLCIVNSAYSDTGNHEQARSLLHTGNFQFVRPSMGSWLVYGLGTENRELPGFVTINATTSTNDYGSAFLPAIFQGTSVNAGDIKNAIPNLSNSRVSSDLQRKNLDILNEINRLKLEQDKINNRLEGMIESYELAFRMQTAVPNIMDTAKETQETLNRYGIGQQPTDAFGKQCLMARKFAEAGVRFIEIGIASWDYHTDIKKGMTERCLSIDKPIAALIADLKNKGMLEETLIVWAGEFGRTPGVQNNATGRDHNHQGYSLWLCGGGVKGGIRYGATDEFGHKAVENKMSNHDLHATILHLMGIDHTKLTYRYSGRDFRLTDVYGEVHHGIIS